MLPSLEQKKLPSLSSSSSFPDELSSRRMELEKKASANNIKNKVKLKTSPKSTTDHDHDQHYDLDDQIQDDQDVANLVCPICNRRLRSAHDLKAHKRDHNLPPKKRKWIGYDRPEYFDDYYDHDDDEVVPLMINHKADDHDQEDDGEKKIRSRSEKGFPSKTSLFGDHMKSLANYSISTQDPIMNNNMVDDSSSSVPPSSDHLNLARSAKLSTWVITGNRRSRKSTGSSSSSFSTAASDFAKVPGMDNNTIKEDVMDHKLRTSSIGGEVQEENWGDFDLGEESSYIMREKRKSMIKSARKKMKLIEPEEKEVGQVITTSFGTTSTSREKKGRGGGYVCTDCKGSFPSHQALGAHMSKHHKKNTKINYNHLSSATTDGNNGDDDGSLWHSAIDGKDDVSAENGGSKNVLGLDLNVLPPNSAD